MKHPYRCCKDGKHRHNWKPKQKVSRRNRPNHTPGLKPNHAARAINIHDVFPPIGAADFTVKLDIPASVPVLTENAGKVKCGRCDNYYTPRGLPQHLRKTHSA